MKYTIGIWIVVFPIAALGLMSGHLEVFAVCFAILFLTNLIAIGSGFAQSFRSSSSSGWTSGPRSHRSSSGWRGSSSSRSSSSSSWSSGSSSSRSSGSSSWGKSSSKSYSGGGGKFGGGGAKSKW